MRRILVTSALPYPNGPVHLGHLFEHVQTDIWVRFQRMAGNECIYVCADDGHGTPTMLRAEQEGVSEEELIARVRAEHEEEFRRFHISHDNYYTTHSAENELFVTFMHERLTAQGHIFTKPIEQYFDPEKGLFLADRYIRGQCPRCGAEDQPGDNCDVCGATYDATDLKSPRSVFSDAEPVLRESVHYFVDLARSADFLNEWIKDHVQPEVANKLREWLSAGLKPWDISRDEPYFGFRIPGEDAKYFYVWMDAPVGYLASFKNWCEASGARFEDFWDPDSDCEVRHFIGKDIINFHCLFWPAVLSGSGFRTPTRIHTHGFITVDGVRMSKSRGTFISAGTYLEHLDPECLRYYFATKFTATMDDVDINLGDFVQRVNTDLVGKVVNIASRCASFLGKHFDSTLADSVHDEALWAATTQAREELAALYERGEVGRAMREVAALADRANQYIAEHEPWKRIKDPTHRDEVHGVCSLGINVFRALMVYLKPVLPAMVAKAEAFLQVESLVWDDAAAPLVGHRIGRFKPLFTRIDRKDVDKVVAATAAEAQARQPASAAAASEAPATIGIDDFLKVDLRVAKVVDAKHVPGADKLLELALDVGDGERRVFSGIRSAYDPASLIGRLTVVVANLAPRKMRFGTSEGMILAAAGANQDGGEDIFIVSPDAGAKPGMAVS